MSRCAPPGFDFAYLPRNNTPIFFRGTKIPMSNRNQGRILIPKFLRLEQSGHFRLFHILERGNELARRYALIDRLASQVFHECLHAEVAHLNRILQHNARDGSLGMAWISRALGSKAMNFTLPANSACPCSAPSMPVLFGSQTVNTPSTWSPYFNSTCWLTERASSNDVPLYWLLDKNLDIGKLLQPGQEPLFALLGAFAARAVAEQDDLRMGAALQHFGHRSRCQLATAKVIGGDVTDDVVFVGQALSKITVGMPSALALRTAATRACESSGARQMPSTRLVTKSCTSEICPSRSLS